MNEFIRAEPPIAFIALASQTTSSPVRSVRLPKRTTSVSFAMSVKLETACGMSPRTASTKLSLWSPYFTRGRVAGMVFATAAFDFGKTIGLPIRCILGE